MGSWQRFPYSGIADASRCPRCTHEWGKLSNKSLHKKPPNEDLFQRADGIKLKERPDLATRELRIVECINVLVSEHDFIFPGDRRRGVMTAFLHFYLGADRLGGAETTPARPDGLINDRFVSARSFHSSCKLDGAHASGRMPSSLERNNDAR